MKCAGNVSCALLRHLLEAAWDHDDMDKAEILTKVVDGLTVQQLQAENAKAM